MTLTLSKIFPPPPNVERGRPCIFDSDPKGESYIYCNRNSVIIRSVKDLAQNDMYTQHSRDTKVAKFSPSGFYIASADDGGKVRIWDTINSEHILKCEYQPFSGAVRDLAWTSDNGRMFVGGEGASTYGSFFIVDTGSSVGTVSCIGKRINSVAFRPVRPYKAVAGDDEAIVTFFDGPPFKFNRSLTNHRGFVNVVRYSKDGSFFVSAGSDGRIFLYHGETGDTIGEVESPAHSGGINGLSFSHDGTLCVTASSDKSLKLWRVAEKNLLFLTQYQFPNIVNNMLLGCIFAGSKIITVACNATLYIFDAPPNISSLENPVSLFGHKSIITCAKYCFRNKLLLTGSVDGCMLAWDITSGLSSMFTGSEAHTSQLKDMILLNDYVISIGLDDRCVVSMISLRNHVSSMKLPSQPTCVDVNVKNEQIIVTCLQHLLLLGISDQRLCMLKEIKVELNAATLTVSPLLPLAIIGTEKSGHLGFSFSSVQLDTMSKTNELVEKADLVSFNPDGSTLSVVKSDRSVRLYKVTHNESPEKLITYAPTNVNWYSKHNARVLCQAWSPNGRRLATGSLDTSIIIMSLDEPTKSIQKNGAHPMSYVTTVCWIDNDCLLSTGHDGSIRIWNIE